MFSLPNEFLLFFIWFSQVFSAPVWESARILVVGTILCQDDRTVASCLKAVGLGETPDFCNYHNVLSRARWSGLAASKILLGLLILLFVPDNAEVMIGADETLERWNVAVARKSSGWPPQPKAGIVMQFGLKVT